MEGQKPRRVSVAVREGPRAESRTEKGLASSVQDIFNCCDGEATCNHRKSLSSDTRLSASWTRVADIPSDLLPFALETAQSPDAKQQKQFQIMGQSQSQEDILDDFQRAVRCLKTDFKTFAASNFDRFINENESRAMKDVWPPLVDQLNKTVTNPAFGEAFHEPASRKIGLAIIELYKNDKEDGARELLAAVFNFVLRGNQENATYWVFCLLNLVELCNSANVQKDIFPSIVGKLVGNGSSTYAKMGACQLFRKLAARFNHEVIQKKLMPIMEVLAKDKDPMVRAAAAINLPEMFHRIKKKDQALKLINQMSVDTDHNVRSAITSTIVQSVSLMNPKEARNKLYLQTVMQTIKVLVKDAYVKANIGLLVAYSEYMGRVCRAFHQAEIMQPRDTLWYLDTFLQLSRYNAMLENATGANASKEEADTVPPGFANFRANMEFSRRQSVVEALLSTKPEGQIESASTAAFDTTKAIAALRANAENKRMSIPYGGTLPATACFRKFGPEFQRAHECRANAAKEFYVFMSFAKPIVDFRYGMHPLVVDLMHDTRPEVRAAMAQQILPIMEYLGPEAALLHGELVYGLTDDDLDVVQTLVPNIARILKCLVIAKVLSPEKVTPKLVEISGAILFCEERLNQTTFYKVHQTMLEQFSALPLCLPGDYIYSNFVPALFHRLRHMRQIPCRMAAANAIVIFLRHCRRSSQREDIRKKIKDGFARGRSVHDRMLFLYIAKRIMEKFSRKYFRDHFFEDVLLLAHDPIGNVRRKVIELMPELNEISDDPVLHNKIDETFRQARKSEFDRDVKETLEKTLTKLRGKYTAGNRNTGNVKDAAKNKKARDPADEAKQIEEEYIASLEFYSVQSMKNATINEKRKTFYGTGARRTSLSSQATNMQQDPPKLTPPAKVDQNQQVKYKI